MCTVHGCVRSVVVSVYKMSVCLSLTIWIHWFLKYSYAKRKKDPWPCIWISKARGSMKSTFQVHSITEPFFPIVLLCMLYSTHCFTVFFSWQVSLCTWRGTIFVRTVFWKCSFNGELMNFFIACSCVTSWREIGIGLEGV